MCSVTVVLRPVYLHCRTIHLLVSYRPLAFALSWQQATNRPREWNRRTFHARITDSSNVSSQSAQH